MRLFRPRAPQIDALEFERCLARAREALLARKRTEAKGCADATKPAEPAADFSPDRQGDNQA
jgi:hypothetical protein